MPSPNSRSISYLEIQFQIYILSTNLVLGLRYFIQKSGSRSTISYLQIWFQIYYILSRNLVLVYYILSRNLVLGLYLIQKSGSDLLYLIQKSSSRSTISYLEIQFQVYYILSTNLILESMSDQLVSTLIKLGEE